MDIPSQFLSKIGVYDIQINGVEIKATIVDRNDQLEKGICELRSLMGDLPLVGVDLKKTSLSGLGLTVPHLLLLYVKNRCLIIQMKYVMPLQESVGHFLSDKSICFVGFKIDSHFNVLRDYEAFKYDSKSCLTGNGAEICLLAASVLKNPSLLCCFGVDELASKIGFDMRLEADKKMEEKAFNWTAFVFTEEEVKYAIHDVQQCYRIGERLLRMLGN